MKYNNQRQKDIKRTEKLEKVVNRIYKENGIDLGQLYME